MATDPSQAPASNAVNVGNPRDIQGILGLVVVGGTLGVGGLAIVLNPTANTTIVFAALLGLAGPIIGFYYGQKSQQ